MIFTLLRYIYNVHFLASEFFQKLLIFIKHFNVTYFSWQSAFNSL